MAGLCRTCTSPERAAIEALMVNGTSLSAIGRQFSMERDALRRHRDRHMTPALVAVRREENRREGLNVTAADRVKALLDKLEAMVERTDNERRESMLLGASRELRAAIELSARLSGELRPENQTTVQVLNIATNPEWQAIKQAMFRTFAQLPNGDEARLLFASEMRAIEGYEEPRPQVIGSRAIAPYRAPVAEEGEFEEQDDA